MKSKFAYVTALLLGLLMLPSCADKHRLQPNEIDEGVGRIALSFDNKAFDVRLRGILSDEAEKSVHHLRLYVFDEPSGSLEYSHVYTQSTSSTPGETRPMTGVTFGSRDTLMVVEQTDDNGNVTGTSEEIVRILESWTGTFDTIELPVGRKRVVLIANADRSVGASFAMRGWEDIKSYDDLLRVTGAMQKENVDFTRAGGSIIMAGETVAEVKQLQEGESPNKVNVPLERTDAQISFQIKTAILEKDKEKFKSITFQPSSWTVRNVPIKTYLVEHARPTDATASSEVSWDAATDPATDFCEVPNQNFDFVSKSDQEAGIVGSGAFYMPENRKLPKAMIPIAEPKDSEAIKNAFHLRGKQLKTPNAGDEYVTNGDYQYAPDLATQLIFSGDLIIEKADGSVRHASVTYRIPLGYAKKDATPEVQLNDYDIERNVYYKYTITIVDAENIVVEAHSIRDNEVEATPQVEGTVVDAAQNFVLDAHYEQFFVQMNRSAVGIYDGDGKARPDATIAFAVQSPFTGGIVERVFNAAELKEISDALATVEGGSWATDPKQYAKVMRTKRAGLSPALRAKLTDTEWIRFAHSGTYKTYSYGLRGAMTVSKELDNTDNRMRYFTEALTATEVRKGALMTLEQFLDELVNHPEEVYDANGVAKFTVFVEEYFYERDPMAMIQNPNIARDKDLWKKFTNQAPRTFEFFGDGKKYFHKSPDQQSRHRNPLFALQQHSIKTIFVKDPTSSSDPKDRFFVWGVNNFPLQKGKYFYYKDHSYVSRKYNTRRTNGWINTWRTMTNLRETDEGSESEYVRSGESIPLRKDDAFWRRAQDPSPEGLKLSTTRFTMSEALALIGRHFDYQIYAPFLANRDEDGSDKFEAREMKWYVPSIAQLQTYGIFLNSLPDVARINTSPDNYRESYMSSTSASTFVAGNFRLLHGPTRVAEHPFADWDYAFYGGSAVNFNDFPGVIIVRDLGILESEDMPSDYYGDRINRTLFPLQEIQVMMPHAIQEDGSFYFSADHIVSNALRSQRVYGELALHHELSSQNKIYRDGFTVARKLVQPLQPKNNDYTDSEGRHLFFKSWKELQRDVDNGMSPCKLYYEREDAKDVGQWRVPNAAELTVISSELLADDWDRIFGPAHRSGKQMIWSRTHMHMSMLHINASKKTWGNFEDQGFALYRDNSFRIFGVQSLHRRWGFFRNINQGGFVRCVRDGKLSDID